MTQRERILAILVGVLVGGVIVFQGVNRFVLETRRELIADRARMENQLEDLRNVKPILEAYKKTWLEWTAQTLSASALETQSEFQKRLLDTLQAAGFRNPDLTKPTIQTAGIFRKDAGFREVRIKATVTGTLAQLQTFLERFYSQPYATAIESITIDPVSEKRSRGRASPRGGEPQLEFVLQAKTLVLPEIDDARLALAHRPLDPESNPLGRLAGQEAVDYSVIASANMFKPYTPPRPTPKPKPDPQPDRKPPPPPPPPPPVIPKYTLVGTQAINGHRFAYARNDDRLELEPEEYRVGDSVHDGELIVIHPHGIVTKKTEDHLGKPVDPPQFFFYELGKSFQERSALNAALHPEVYQAVQEVTESDESDEDEEVS
jgi:hypothetical protein